VRALDLDAFQFLVLDNDVDVLVYLVPLGSVGAIYGLTRYIIDQLLPETVPRLAVHLPKRHPLSGGRRRMQSDGARNERQLEIAFPIRTRGHYRQLLNKQRTDLPNLARDTWESR
jgi:hypothetical protein